MKYLPFEKFTLKTKMSVEDAKNKLAQNLVERKWLRFTLFSSVDKPFEGTITNDTFDINRIIQYRNSFLPFVFGKFSKTYNGTEIEIKMRINMVVFVFMSFWMFVVGTVGVFMIGNIAISPGQFSPLFLIPVGMFLFGYLLIMGAYNIERGKTKTLLLNIFEATEEIE